MIKYFLISLLIWIFISSCFRKYPNPYKDCKVRPLTQEEIKLKKTINSDPNQVYIFRMSYIYRPNTKKCVEDCDSNYTIAIIDQDTNLLKDINSSDSYSKILALKIYNEVMFDSLKFSTPKIIIEMSNYSKTKQYPDGFKYCVFFNKKDIEQYNGRKLIQGKKGYEWVEIEKVEELKINRGDCD